MKNLATILSGGDLRSIGQSTKIVSLINNQKEFNELFQHLFHEDRKVVMRAADAIEKITLKDSKFLAPHTNDILKLCSKAENIELKWHLALLVSRIKLSKQQLDKAWQVLNNWATNKKESKIVRVNSLQGLFNLLAQNKEMEQNFKFILSEVEKENIKSLNARIRKLKISV